MCKRGLGRHTDQAIVHYSGALHSEDLISQHFAVGNNLQVWSLLRSLSRTPPTSEGWEVSITLDYSV